MNIEPGKVYLNRKGQRCKALSLEGPKSWPLVVEVMDGAMKDRTRLLNRDGTYYGIYREDPWDLVEEAA
jgi:hypothetical protein